jgi:hypothetical protein
VTLDLHAEGAGDDAHEEQGQRHGLEDEPPNLEAVRRTFAAVRALPDPQMRTRARA